MLKIKNKTENIKEVTDFVKEPLSLEATALIEEIKIMQKDINYRKLKITGGNNVTYDFSNYKIFNDLHFDKMTIDRAEMKQDEFNSTLAVLNNYAPKSKKYIEAKNSLLNNAKNFYFYNLMINLKKINRLVKKTLLINQRKLILMN